MRRALRRAAAGSAARRRASRRRDHGGQDAQPVPRSGGRAWSAAAASISAGRPGRRHCSVAAGPVQRPCGSSGRSVPRRRAPRHRLRRAGRLLLGGPAGPESPVTDPARLLPLDQQLPRLPRRATSGCAATATSPAPGATTDDFVRRGSGCSSAATGPRRSSTALSEDTDLVTDRDRRQRLRPVRLADLHLRPGGRERSRAGRPAGTQFTDANGVDTKARDARRDRGPRGAGRRRGPRAARREAEVYLVGYPRMLPDDGTTCAQAPLATGDYAWANRIGALLNRSVRLAAERGGVHVRGAGRRLGRGTTCAPARPPGSTATGPPGRRGGGLPPLPQGDACRGRAGSTGGSPASRRSDVRGCRPTRRPARWWRTRPP